MRGLAKKLLACCLSVAALMGMSACEGQVPKVARSSAPPVQQPDLTPKQEEAVRAKIGQVLDKANGSKDPSGLEERVTGPQLQIRSSELAIAKVTGQLNPKTTIPDKIAQTVIPGESGWPRSVFAVTTTTEDLQSNRLLVLTQDSARENYKLWGVARLFQKAELPKFPVETIAAQMGRPDDKGLKVTPAEAVNHYADLLQNPESSKFADDFAPDDFRKSMASLTDTVRRGMEANHGSQSQTFTPADGQIRVMRSSDGGDLAVAQINAVWTRQAGEGRQSLPASDSEKALFGDGHATSTMRVSYVIVVALYIPGSSSAEKIRAVGAEWQPVKVEAI